jgi:hypothetical protein
MEDGGLHLVAHGKGLQQLVNLVVLLQRMARRVQAGWMPTAKKLSWKVRHHLKEEESKFFQVAGRLLSETKKKQLARKYTREIVRMRGHYGAEYASILAAGSSGPVNTATRVARADQTPARPGTECPATSSARR